MTKISQNLLSIITLSLATVGFSTHALATPPTCPKVKAIIKDTTFEIAREDTKSPGHYSLLTAPTRLLYLDTWTKWIVFMTNVEANSEKQALQNAKHFLKSLKPSVNEATLRYAVSITTDKGYSYWICDYDTKQSEFALMTISPRGNAKLSTKHLTAQLLN